MRTSKAWLCLLVAGPCLIIAAGMIRSSISAKVQGIRETDDTHPLSQRPFSLPRRNLNCGWKSSAKTDEKMKRLLWPARGESFSAVLHGLHLFGENEAPPRPGLPTVEDLKRVLLSDSACSDWYEGKHSLVRTRYGARYIDMPANADGVQSQAHRDQTLAVLGEIGVSLSSNISTPEGMIQLSEVLNDAIANFSPTQEIEWTAVAFALYLAPQKGWTDKFGEEHTFDSLAKLLLAKSYLESSCGGTHILYSLTVMYGVDRTHSILSAPIRLRIRQRLAAAARALQVTQEPSGRFATEWYLPLVEAGGDVSSASQANRKWGWATGQNARSTPVLATGHHLEWLLISPEDLQVDPKMIHRAAEFLSNELMKVTEDDVLESFCPIVHAAYVLRHLR